MLQYTKVKRIAITAFIVVVMAFVFCNLFTVQAHAAGLLDETIDATHEFSKYSINNYQLDFYVDTSSGLAAVELERRFGSKPFSMRSICSQTLSGQ